MKREELEQFMGKRVKLQRTDSYFFVGSIQHLNGDSLTFVDKFGKLLVIRYDAVESVLEV